MRTSRMIDMRQTPEAQDARVALTCMSLDAQDAGDRDTELLIRLLLQPLDVVVSPVSSALAGMMLQRAHEAGKDIVIPSLGLTIKGKGK
jgi:hypothetical protein